MFCVHTQVHSEVPALFTVAHMYRVVKPSCENHVLNHTQNGCTRCTALVNGLHWHHPNSVTSIVRRCRRPTQEQGEPASNAGAVQAGSHPALDVAVEIAVSAKPFLRTLLLR